jgi:hypothetical protein
MWSGVVEYVQREGYAEKYRVRPMRILRDAVSLEMLKNGGRLTSLNTTDSRTSVFWRIHILL